MGVRGIHGTDMQRDDASRRGPAASRARRSVLMRHMHRPRNRTHDHRHEQQKAALDREPNRKLNITHELPNLKRF